jgi:tetratricopeptide (TPR) repeat protein
MGQNESPPDRLARRFAALLTQHKQANGWSNTWMAQAIWEDDNRRGHISGYLRGTMGSPSESTVAKFCAKLGIPDADREALYLDARSNWPVIRDPSIAIERDVVGRDEALATLHSLLTETRAVAILQRAQPGAVVRASGGMGKSALARLYAVTHSHRYHGVWWLNAASRQNLIQDLTKLCSALALPTSSNPTHAAQNVIIHLQQQSDPWLLIYDNAEKPADLRGLIPEQGSVHLLYTSRNSVWGRVKEVPLDRLEVESAADVLLREAERSDDRPGAIALAQLLGGLPLALVCAGAWLRDVPSASFAHYAAQHEALLRHKPDRVDDYPDSVYGAVKMSLEKLSDEAQLLSKVIAYLAPDDLWPGLITALSGKDQSNRIGEMFSPVPDELWSLAKDPFLVEKSFAELTRRSLLTPGETKDSWRIHRLTQAVQRGLLEDEATIGPKGDWPGAAAAIVAAGYPDPAGVVDTFPICARLNPHVAALDEMRGGAPARRAMEHIYSLAGTYYWSMRQDRLALRYAIAMIRTMRRRGVSENAVLMGTGWNKLATRLLNAGHLVWAVRASDRAVAIIQTNPAAPDEERAVCLSANGTFHYYLGKHRGGDAQLLNRARKQLHEALRLGRKVHGRNSREVGNRLNNLGAVHIANGRGGAAAVLWRTALAVRRKVLPPTDADIGQACNNLGEILLQRGQIYEAEPLLLEALQIREAAYSANPQHPNTLKAAHDLVHVYLVKGDPAEAKRVAFRHGLDLPAMEVTAEEIKRQWAGNDDRLASASPIAETKH